LDSLTNWECGTCGVNHVTPAGAVNCCCHGKLERVTVPSDVALYLLRWLRSQEEYLLKKSPDGADPGTVLAALRGKLKGSL